MLSKVRIIDSRVPNCFFKAFKKHKKSRFWLNQSSNDLGHSHPRSAIVSKVGTNSCRIKPNTIKFGMADWLSFFYEKGFPSTTEYNIV